MATEYINPQWRLPNEKTGNNQDYSMKSFSASHRVKIPGLANSLNLTNEVSLSIWFKTTLSQNNYYILGLRGPGSANGFDLGMHGSNIGSYAAFATSGSGGLLVNFAYDDGNWHHYVLTYNGSIRKFYIDGVLKAESAASGNMSLDSSGDYFILATSDYFNKGGQGEYVDNCVFDYALSDGGVSVGSTATGQIADLYASTNPMALASPPQAYYPLGNSAHMGSNYLTLNGALQDYVFDFNPGYFNLGATSIVGNTYSLSLWFKSTSTSTMVISEKVTSSPPWPYRIYLYGSSGNLELIGTQTSGTAYNDGNWHHVVIVQDPSLSTGQSKGYVDGFLETSNNVSGSVDGSNNFYIGGRNGTQLPYNGELSNFQLFNTALSGPEVETLYNYGSPIQTLANIPQSSNLKAWYKLDATEIYNSSSTEWEVNNALSTYTSSLFVDNSISSPSYIKINNLNSTSGLSEYSFSAWVDLKSVNTNYGGLINAQYSSNWAFLGNVSTGGSSWRWDLRTSSGTTQASVTAPLLNQGWCHIAGTYDGANMKFYKNGEEVFTGAKTGTMQTGSFEVDLGLLYGTNDVNSGYSNFSIWNKGLTPSEVNELYNSGNPGDLLSHSATSNLLNWWKLNNLTDGLNDLKGSFNAVIVSDVSDKPGSVSTLNGESSGMSQSSLVQSDLLTTSSYSPYALSFDGNDFVTLGSLFNQVQDVFSVSTWVNFTSNPGYQMILSDNIWFANYTANNIGLDIKNSSGNYYDNNGGLTQGTNFVIPSNLRTNKWIHVAFSYEGNSSGTTAVIKMYLNGNEMVNTTVTYSTGNANLQNASNVYLGSRNGGTYFLDGSISNVSIWNAALTASQIREVYNEGRPSNLHNFSGTAPVAWWQLGSNSSWTSPRWTVLDEIGSNDGTSTSMLENAIVDGVGTSGNGVSVNMGLANNISGSSPNGEGNSLSVNMTLANIAGGVN
jgi:hypothetical protein